MIESCIDCPQYVAKEIEPELPAFCLYWKEGLMLESPTCRNYKEGRIPEEPVSPLSGLETAAPHDQAGSADYRVTSQLPDQNFSEHGDDNTLPSPQAEQREADLHPGRHLVKITSVRGYMHNFQEYAGKRARLTFKVMEGLDAGKFLFDNISLLHPKESKDMLLRRLRIAKRLGLITRGPNGEIIQQGGWKLLEGVVCWVDVAYKNLGGRTVPTIDNYELVEYGAHTQPAPPLPVAGAEVKPVVEESQEPTPPPPPATCESCPWYELNPWTHDPALGAWCHRRMEPLVTGTPACEEFHRGEVPSRQPYQYVPAVPAAGAPASSEHTTTCYECHHFEANRGPNPRQGWGRCLKRSKGNFGCSTACEAAITDDGAGPDKLSDREIRYLGRE